MTLRFVGVDVETRSTVDLRRTGVYPYAAHPTTDVWCVCWAVDDGPLRVWHMGRPVPQEFIDLAADPNVFFTAWNAAFERIIFRDLLTPRHGFPAIPLERWVCTMVLGKASGVPGSLEQAAIALGLQEQKDAAGSRLMMQMAKPRAMADGSLVWWDDAGRRKRLAQYCAQDVVVERAIRAILPPAMDRRERQIYLLDQRINDRGVRIDIDLVEAMHAVAGKEQVRLSREIKRVTRGVVPGITKLADLRDWVSVRVGESIATLDKEAVALWLDRDIPEDVREALVILREGSKSSVKKLSAMRAAAGEGDRARGLLQYYGAGTGRWAGRLIQPQNFPRGSVKVTPDVIDALRATTLAAIRQFGEPLEVISSALRGCLIAPEGEDFVVADFNAIEARVVAWLAGQSDLVELFRTGGKVYEEMGATIYNRPASEILNPSEERNVAKETVLGGGFQMGGPRFRRQLAKRGIEVTEAFAKETIDAYRTKNHRIVALWYSMQDTAIAAVTRGARRPISVPGTNGRLSFRVRGHWLAMGLPSGRSLWYCNPRIVEREVPWGGAKPAVEIDTVNGYTRKWEAQAMYGGLWTENATQAVARDLMADAMFRVEEAGFRVALTVHDEIIATVRHDDLALETFVDLLAVTPAWAAGCPVIAEGWRGARYRK